jgi:hypothetical protein
MTFAEQVANFAQRTERRLAKTVSGAATKLAANIIKSTPIDLAFGLKGPSWAPWHDPTSVGEARGGWVAGFDANLNSPAERLDPSGESTSRNAGIVYAAYSPRAHMALYLVNTVEYIGKLEFGGYDEFNDDWRNKSLPTGFSFQAPYGMMHVNAKAWPSLVSNAARVSRTIR